MANAFFITGTDTGVGKTLATEALLQAASVYGLCAVGYKPVASGCERINGELKNYDALALQHASSLALPYAMHNPYAFAPAIAPHIAATQAQQRIETARLSEGLAALKKEGAECIFVEGAGGWRLPISEHEYLSDWVQQEQLPVILVVGIQLGCINHALLTLEAIRHDGLQLAGWVSNQLHPNMSQYQANVEALKQRISAPLLGEIPWLEGKPSDSVDAYINIDPLFKNN